LLNDRYFNVARATRARRNEKSKLDHVVASTLKKAVSNNNLKQNRQLFLKHIDEA